MAMNWLQLEKPRACRSAWCFSTAAWNWAREKSWRIWLKMLHTTLMVEALSVSKWFCDDPLHLTRGSTCFSMDALPRFQKLNLDNSELLIKDLSLTTRL